MSKKHFYRSAGALCLSFALAACSATPLNDVRAEGSPQNDSATAPAAPRPVPPVVEETKTPTAPPPIPVITSARRSFVCRSTLMMDINGQVIAQDDADVSRYPASITKVMTMILVFDALKAGTLKLDDRITFSRHAVGQQRTNLGVSAGTTISVEDGIKALAVHSANDVAVAFAEHLKGSESRFAAAMTAKARAIGMNDTTFKNASGLPSGGTGKNARDLQVTTARDIARMSQYLIQQYPGHYHYFAEQTFTWRGATYKNHNKSLGVYPGVDGIKTGYIRKSMFNIAASATRPEGRLIVALFGCPSTPARTQELEALFDLGFEALRKQRDATPAVTVDSTPAVRVP